MLEQIDVAIGLLRQISIGLGILVGVTIVQSAILAFILATGMKK